MAFVHLRAHTEFSVVDGTLRIDDAVAAAAADGQGALAITDVSNLFGAVKFYSAARRAGVKPILGAEVCMAAEGGREGAEPAGAAGAEPRRLPEPVRAALARLAAQRGERPRDRSSGRGSANAARA